MRSNKSAVRQGVEVGPTWIKPSGLENERGFGSQKAGLAIAV
jgi:hypothetical protein